MKFRDYSKYEVYEDGRIWSYSHKKFLKPATRKNGYQQVHLYDNEGKPKMYQVHRVVFEAVTGEPIPNDLQINHINEDKTDNRFENLNLMTCKQNINWGTRTERAAKARINGKRSKQVGAYKNGELVLVFPSTQEAQRNGFHSGHISDCCNGKLPHYKGFEWKYLN